MTSEQWDIIFKKYCRPIVFGIEEDLKKITKKKDALNDGFNKRRN